MLRENHTPICLTNGCKNSKQNLGNWIQQYTSDPESIRVSGKSCTWNLHSCLCHGPKILVSLWTTQCSPATLRTLGLKQPWGWMTITSRRLGQLYADLGSIPADGPNNNPSPEAKVVGEGAGHPSSLLTPTTLPRRPHATLDVHGSGPWDVYDQTRERTTNWILKIKAFNFLTIQSTGLQNNMRPKWFVGYGKNRSRYLSFH